MATLLRWVGRLVRVSTAVAKVVSIRGRAPDPRQIVLHLGAPGGDGVLSERELLQIVDQLPGPALLSLRGPNLSTHASFWPLLERAAATHYVEIVVDGSELQLDDLERLLALAPRRIGKPGLVLVTLPVMGAPTTHDSLLRQKGAAACIRYACRTLRSLRFREKLRYPLLAVQGILDERTLDEYAEVHGLAKGALADVFHIAFTPQDGTELQTSSNDDDTALQQGPEGRQEWDWTQLRREMAAIDAARRLGEDDMELVVDHGLTSADAVVTHLERTDHTRLHCDAPWRWMLIGTTGNVHVCPAISLGTVRQLPPMDRYHGGSARSFRTRLRKEGSFPACAGCAGARGR